jgi:hypothetical protein
VKRRQKKEEWLREFRARQQNILLPDTMRNRVRFWYGIRHQKLKRMQAIGLAVLCAFYVTVLVASFRMTWPGGDSSFLRKLVYGYGTQVLICLPAFLLLAFLLRRITRG